MCKIKKYINGVSQKVGTLLSRNNFGVLILLDKHNNQKHFMVSHLTTQEEPKRLSYSADVKMRSATGGQNGSRMMCDLHQYVLLLSEKCMLIASLITLYKTHSEKCQQPGFNVHMLWHVS